MKKYNEEDEIARWNSYARANDQFPDVRKAELEMQMQLVNPQTGEIIVEVGTGNGILTYPMARRVGFQGKIYSFDYRKENLVSAMQRNSCALPIVFVPQSDNPQTGKYTFPLAEGSVDKISTIAAFHHYDDRSLRTGTNGRINALNEFYRILKRGGKITIGDIANNTPTQRYFDQEMDNPQSPAYCHPRGHPHDFMDEETARELCTIAGFKNIEFRIEKVPFEFNNENEAKTFFHMVHNAKGSLEDSLKCVKKHFDIWNKNNKLYLGWNLAYLTAQK